MSSKARSGRSARSEPYRVDLHTVVEESGFRRQGDNVDIQFLQDGYLPKFAETSVKQYRKLEIDFLRSLSEVGPELYTVQPGDNLWDLTGEKFGDPRLFLLIADYAGIRPEKLQVGDVLKLPRWYELCQKLKPNKLFVRDNQSLWAKAEAGEIPFDFRSRSAPKRRPRPHISLRGVGCRSRAPGG